MAEIDRLNIEVTADTSQAINALKELQGVLNSFGSFDTSNIEGSLQNIQNAFSNMYTKVGTQIDAMQDAFGNMFSTAIEEAQEAMTSMEFGINGTSEVGKAVEQVEELKHEAESATDYMGNLSTNQLFAVYSDTFANIDNAFARIRGTLGTFAKGVGTATGYVVRLGSAIFTLPFGALKKKVEQSVKAFNKLGKSIARVVMYRALRGALKAVTEGFSEGVKAVSRYSRALGGEFSQTMDDLTSHLALLNGSLGAMASPLVEALAPAIHTVVDAVITLINAINQLFSILAGKSGWTKATSAVQKYDDTVKGAKSSQDKLTAGIDELNVLKESSSGSSSSADYDFETVELDSWAQYVKELFDERKFAELGKYFADALNSIIESWDASAWGAKLGTALNDGITVALNFMRNFNSLMLGQKFGEFIAGAIDKIDTQNLGELFAEKYNRILDFVIGFSLAMKEIDLAEKFVGFFEGALDAFNPYKLAESVNLVAGGVLDFIAEVTATFPTSRMFNALSTFFASIKWGELGTSFGKALNGVVNMGLDIVNGILDILNGKPLNEGLNEFFANACDQIDVELISLKIERALLQAFDIVATKIKEITDFREGQDLLSRFLMNIFDGGRFYADYDKKQEEALENTKRHNTQWLLEQGYTLEEIEKMEEEALGKTNSIYDQKMAELDEQIKIRQDALAKSVSEGSQKITDSNNWSGFATSPHEAMELMKTSTENGTQETQTTIDNFLNGISQDFTTYFPLMADQSEASMAEVQQICENHSMLAQEAVAEHLGATAVTAGEKIAEIKQVTSTSWSDIANTTVTDWQNIQNTVANVWAKLDGLAKERFASIEKYVKTAWLNLQTDTTLKWGENGTITTTLTTALNNTLLKFKEVFMDEGNVQTLVKNAFTEMETAIKTSTDNAYTSIDTFVTNSINRFEDLIREIEKYNSAESSSGADAEITINPKGYASGGFVSSGELFMARENGIPEMVGSFGGHGAVANNDMIVEGITAGVYSAVVSAMSQSGKQNQELRVYLDGKQIEASVRNTRQRRGATIASGGVINYA